MKGLELQESLFPILESDVTAPGIARRVLWGTGWGVVLVDQALESDL